MGKFFSTPEHTYIHTEIQRAIEAALEKKVRNRKEKKTIILITHDIHLVEYAQKVIYIKDGEIIRIKHNHRK